MAVICTPAGVQKDLITSCRSAVPGANRGEDAAPTINDLDSTQDVLSKTKHIGREAIRFANRDVGEGREQDALRFTQHILLC